MRGSRGAYYLLLFFFGVLLNQAMVVIGVNLSSADLLLLPVVYHLVKHRALYADMKWLILFAVIIVMTAFSDFFFVMMHFKYETYLSTYLVDLVKLVVSFLYFCVGYSLYRKQSFSIVFKGFCDFATLIAVVGCSGLVFYFGPLHDQLFFGGFRLRGLMNDPNFFAVLQNVALAYIVYNWPKEMGFKFLRCLLLAASILLSGSKTGLIIMLVIVGYRGMSVLVYGLLVKMQGKYLVLGILSAAVVFLGGYIVYDSLDVLKKISPSIERTVVIFENMDEAMAGGGSGRQHSWGNAMLLIDESPIFGIGLGNYRGLSRKLFGYTVIAHNTYLQLAVEWGLVLTLLFFSMILYRLAILKLFKSERNIKYIWPIIVFLMGSLSISLNNSRLFWLLLGALVVKDVVGGKMTDDGGKDDGSRDEWEKTEEELWRDRYYTRI